MQFCSLCWLKSGLDCLIYQIKLTLVIDIMTKLAGIKSAWSASPNWTVDQVIEIIKLLQMQSNTSIYLIIIICYSSLSELQLRLTRRNLITLQKIALLLSIKVTYPTKHSITHSNDLKVLFWWLWWSTDVIYRNFISMMVLWFIKIWKNCLCPLFPVYE